MHLKYDALLLANVVEKFRNSSSKNYGLSPSHYFSAPDLCWDAMLNVTKVGLEFISDAGMYSFFVKCMTQNKNKKYYMLRWE